MDSFELYNEGRSDFLKDIENISEDDSANCDVTYETLVTVRSSSVSYLEITFTHDGYFVSAVFHTSVETKPGVSEHVSVRVEEDEAEKFTQKYTGGSLQYLLEF